VTGSSYEGTLRAPLDLLISSCKKFEDLDNEHKEKLQKVSYHFISKLASNLFLES
jgi:hypothetical protein